MVAFTSTAFILVPRRRANMNGAIVCLADGVGDEESGCEGRLCSVPFHAHDKQEDLPPDRNAN